MKVLSLLRLRVYGPRLPWQIDLLLAASFTFFAVQVLRSPGGLQTGHTDHLRHATEAWLFVRHGFELYRQPLSSFAADASLRVPHISWADYPTTYPPGMVLLFLPFGAGENWAPLSSLPEDVLHRWSIVILLFIAHIAVQKSTLAMSYLRRQMVLLPALMIYFFAVRWSLAGQYDVAFLAAGAAGCLALARARYARSVFWLSLAFFLHYRALIFLPVGIFAMVKLAQSREALSKRSILLLAFSAPMIGLSLYTLKLCLWSADKRYVANAAFFDQPNHFLFMLCGLVAVATTLTVRSWLDAALIANSMLLAVTDRLSAEWHLLYFLAPLVATRTLFSRQVVLAWALVATPLVWPTEHVGTPLWLVSVIDDFVH